MSSFICQIFFTLVINFHWIFFTLQGKSVGGSSIVISKEEVTWLNANRICRDDYGGKLLTSVEGSQQKVECLSKYTSNDQLWSRKGIVLSPYLSHEGCFQILNNMSIQERDITPVHSVGECYIHCQNRTDFFGIKIDTCLCITDEEKLMMTKSNLSSCEHTCRDSIYDKFEFCGGKSALNLYKGTEVQLTGTQGVGKCAVIDCTYRDYHISVQECNSNFSYVCAGENYQNGQNVYFTTATSVCISQYKHYLSPELSPLCNTQQSQVGVKYWLDVRRYWAPTSDIQPGTRRYEFKCGYFISGISSEMGYEENCISSTIRRRFACETDNKLTQGNGQCWLISKAETTKLQSQATLQELSTFTSSISTNNQEKIDSTYTSNTTKGNIDLMSMHAVKTGDSSAIVGAVVGVLVTSGLVVASIIFIIFRRRRIKQKESDKSEEIQECQESKNEFRLEEKQNTLQNHGIDQESRHYFKLDPIPKNKIDVGSPPQEHLQREDEYNEADDIVYDETGNDVYDHLNKKRKKITDNEDMYHIANGFECENDEYQHIHSVEGITRWESSSDYAKFNEDQYSAVHRGK